MTERITTSAKVLIASPGKAVRSRWLQGLAGKYAVQEAADRAELERCMAGLHPAILLLDLALPGLNGLEALPVIRRLNQSTKVLLLTDSPTEGEGVSALKMGVMGYCKREPDPSLMRKIVGTVLEGQVWVGRSVIHHLLEELAAGSDRQVKHSARGHGNHLDHLTPREREVAYLVGAGASNKEIANRLNITEATVKAHLTPIFRKLKLTDRLQLALLVTESTRSADPH